jgi:hypothetical protein
VALARSSDQGSIALQTTSLTRSSRCGCPNARARAFTTRRRFELAARHRSEERPREFLVVALELGDERVASGCEGHQGCSPVGRVRLARHEPLRNKCIDEAGHGSRRHLQRFREHALRHRSELAQLPEQVSAGRSKAERGVRLRHVVVQHDHELKDAIEEILVLL